MATIKPFCGLRLNGEKENPLDFLTEGSLGSDIFEVLEAKLEPKEKEIKTHIKGLAEAGDFLAELISEGHYLRDNELCLYVYERISAGRSVTGVFALTSTKDFGSGHILTHEDTFAAVEDQIIAYRNSVGLEGSAILLAHEPSKEISGLIFKALNLRNGFSQIYQDELHKFAKVTAPDQIREFQLAFSRLHHVHLADGHHRSSAVQKDNSGWILSLYMSTADLQISPIHRIVRSKSDIERQASLARIGEYFYLSQVPNNIAYRPLQKNRLGMFASGRWYQLDLRPELRMDSPIDAVLLQQNILSRIFGISDPSSDGRLECFHDKDWRELLLAVKEDGNAVAFTLCPMGMDEFLRVSLTGIKLPPKSTSIGPKPVFGMLMHSLKNIREGDR